MLSSRQDVKLIGDPAVPGALRVPTTFSAPPRDFTVVPAPICRVVPSPTVSAPVPNTNGRVPNGRVRLWVSVPSSMNPCKDVAAPVFPVSLVGSSWLLDTPHASWLVFDIALFITTGETEFKPLIRTPSPTPDGVYPQQPESSGVPDETPETVFPVTVVAVR